MFKIIFSDIDGTLAHYPKHFQEFGEIVAEDLALNKAVYRDKESGEQRECNVLKSLTAGNAYVSLKSIELVNKIRQSGVLFALITGARKSTLLKRLALLPKADIAIGENGGRIYINGKLDLDWTERFLDITGDIETEEPSETRRGILWDLYRKLTQEGWTVDAKDYFANFRINFKKSPNKTEDDLKTVTQNLPSGITSAYNLGMADFYPSVSGKGSAVRYILEKFSIAKKESVCLMDDDNDLPMAEAVGAVMLPGITNDSVKIALEKNTEWIVSRAKGILGVEELLEKLKNKN